MSNYKYLTPQLLLKAICNAIRAKTGSNDKIVHQDIPDELDSIIIINEEEYNIEMQRVIDIIEGTSFINDRITIVKSELFYNCTNLTTINLPKCTSIDYGAFRVCTSLTTINLPKCTSIGEYAFYYCTNLTTVNLPKCTSIGDGAFHSCTNLTTIILSNNQIVSLMGFLTFNNSGISRGSGYVYVPDNLVDSYKTATNWSNYANRIKPISELPNNIKEEYGYD